MVWLGKLGEPKRGQGEEEEQGKEGEGWEAFFGGSLMRFFPFFGGCFAEEEHAKGNFDFSDKERKTDPLSDKRKGKGF